MVSVARVTFASIFRPPADMRVKDSVPMRVLIGSSTPVSFTTVITRMLSDIHVLHTGREGNGEARERSEGKQGEHAHKIYKQYKAQRNVRFQLAYVGAEVEEGIHPIGGVERDLIGRLVEGDSEGVPRA